MRFFFFGKQIDNTVAIRHYIFQSTENETCLPFWQSKYMCWHYEGFTDSKKHTLSNWEGAVCLSTF